MACSCINIRYTETGGTEQSIIVLWSGLTWDGEKAYSWISQPSGTTLFLYYNANPSAEQWEISNALGGLSEGGDLFLFAKETPPPCPPFDVSIDSGVWSLGDALYQDFEIKECDGALKCITICYSVGEIIEPTCIDVAIYDVGDDGKISYQFQVPEYPNTWFRIYYDAIGFAPFGAGWYISTLGEDGEWISYLENSGIIPQYPYSNDPESFGWSQNEFFNVLQTSEAKSCPVEPSDCGCGMEFTWYLNGFPLETQLVESDDYYNDRLVYVIPEVDPIPSFVCFWNGYAWQIATEVGGVSIGQLYGNFQCPIGLPLTGEPVSLIGYWVITGDAVAMETKGVSCTTCGIEDRIYRQVESVKLPKSELYPDLTNDCCCRQLVLGGEGESWETDITPIWVKLDNSGTSTFKLLKNGVNATYQPEMKQIVRETNSFYAEVHWNDVLASDGAGCYTLTINYNIGGISGFVIWGEYELMPFNEVNARYTARVRAVFNSYFYKENIDFTDTNMQGTLRFYGMIGKRQPNTEIDNIIYGNRELKSVIRENLNKYTIETDPLDECILKPLIDLYLLHENQLFISDYNYHNHSYQYKDLPVILDESAEVTYYQWSRKASVEAKVIDKIQNNMNYYK